MKQLLCWIAPLAGLFCACQEKMDWEESPSASDLQFG